MLLLWETLPIMSNMILKFSLKTKNKNYVLFNHINNEILSHTGDHICQILGFIVILMILGTKSNILTIWGFIPLFWRFLDHHNVYFNTLKATLSFIFGLHLLLLNIYVSGDEEWSITVLSYLRTLVTISLYFMPFYPL